MKKTIKQSLKRVVVKSCDWDTEIDIDSMVFDDIYMEAATRVMEKNHRSLGFNVSVIIECYEKKDAKQPDLHYIYNTYYVLINAGLYEKAESLRKNFKKEHHIDLQKESLKSSDNENNGSSASKTN